MKILLIILTIFLVGSAPGTTNTISVGQVLTDKNIKTFKIEKCNFEIIPKKGTKLYQFHISKKDSLIIEIDAKSKKILSLGIYKNVDQAKAFRTFVIVNSYTFKKK